MKMVEMLALATVVSDGVTRKCKILDFAVLTVPRVIRMPHAKFGPRPLNTVVVHNKQRNRHTDRFAFIAVTFSYSRQSEIQTCKCNRIVSIDERHLDNF